MEIAGVAAVSYMFVLCAGCRVASVTNFVEWMCLIMVVFVLFCAPKICGVAQCTGLCARGLCPIYVHGLI